MIAKNNAFRERFILANVTVAKAWSIVHFS
jgi:hypothetical protein